MFHFTLVSFSFMEHFSTFQFVILFFTIWLTHQQGCVVRGIVEPMVQHRQGPQKKPGFKKFIFCNFEISEITVD